MRGLALILCLAAGACRSSAPYTLPSAILNSGLAAGASLEQRAAGGCFATCAYGTVCNPRTGLCESRPAPALCLEGENGSTRCGPMAPPLATERKLETKPPGLEPILGVSPETGRAPPPPHRPSPEAP